MTLLNYSVELEPGVPENVNTVQTMFNEVRAIVNSLDSDNIDSIDLDKINVPDNAIPATALARMGDGQVIVGQGVGVNNANRTLSGAIALAGSGAVTIGNAGVDSADVGMLQDGITFAPICEAAALPAGVYAVIAKCYIEGDNTFKGETRLRVGATVYDICLGEVTDGGFGGQWWDKFICADLVAVNGAETITFEGVVTQIGGAYVAKFGRLVAIKVS